jgi:hypothetical protein
LYINALLDGFEVPPRRIEFMSSDGGLRKAQKYSGNAALISGPAGGVVDVARSCCDFKNPRALIGFDMVWIQLRTEMSKAADAVSRVVPVQMYAVMTASLITSVTRRLPADESAFPC